MNCSGQECDLTALFSPFILSTVASWNTQMVAMMDGTYAERGSQVGLALAGYITGLLAATAAFVCGRALAQRWSNRKESSPQRRRHQQSHSTTTPGVSPTPTFDECDEEQPCDNNNNNNMRQGSMSLDQQLEFPKDEECPSSGNSHDVEQLGDEEHESINRKATPQTHDDEDGDSIQSLSSNQDEEESNGQGPFMQMNGSILAFSSFLVVMALILGFAYGDVSGYLFYRRLWMTCLCTPVGAVLRSQLKQWLPANAKKSLQYGTLTANVLGAALSILLEVVLVRYLADDDDSWLAVFVWACKVGFAGSLSTVSTLVKELVGLETQHDRISYGVVTLVTAMSVGLAIYSPLVRV